MFDTLDIFKTAHAAAKHAAGRQSVVAENVANSDTPGFKARDIGTFEDLVNQSSTSGLRTTRETHINTPANTRSTGTFIDRNLEASPNGNTVSIETEMLKSIEAERQHSRAMAVYQSSLNILRSSLGRGG
ncbi:MAG: FlgB family protein [Pseudomonadota bacterium]